MAGVFRTVSIYDPAIDLDESDMDAFAASRDPKYVKAVKGKKPAVFHLRDIPRAVHVRYIEALSGDTNRATAAFECAVVRVENLEAMDGTTMPVFEPKWSKDGDSRLVSLTDEELELFHPNDVADIGGVAYQRCFLRPGTNPHFAVPPMLQQRLQMERRPPVDEVLKELTRLREESSTPSETTDGEASGAPTDATAKDKSTEASASATST